MFLVVMGVAGCGKSSLGLALAQALRLPLIEGDDHHSPASRAKMSEGIALTDADREGWLTTLGQLHATIEREGLASPSVIVVGDVVRGVASVSQPAPGQASATRRTG